MELHNTYYILRHGEALSNVKQVVSSWPETFENPLTQKGVQMIQESAKRLIDLTKRAEESVDLIFSSDLLRTKQTAQIMADALHLEVHFDKRLREIDFGTMNGGAISDLDIKFKSETERVEDKMNNGETYEDVQERVWDFLMDINKKYQNKVILIVSHECPLWILEASVNNISVKEGLATIPREARIHKGEIRKLYALSLSRGGTQNTSVLAGK